MKISKLAYIFIITCITIILGYLGFVIFSFTNNDNQITCVQLDVNFVNDEEIQLITDKEIAKTLERNDLNPIGKSYRHIHTESIEKALLENPMIKSAECYKTPAGTVRIKISQRIPKFMIAGQENYYIDTDRQLFPVSLNQAAYVPVVSGRITRSFATGKLFDFVSFITEDPFWNAQIEQIYIREDLKIVLVPRVGDATIVLGKLDNYELKLEKLYRLYKGGFNTMGWNHYEKIDLQYDNQIVCTKKGLQTTKPKIEIVQNNDSSTVKKI